MSQLQSTVLFDTDPLLRQSVEVQGMPEPLVFKFPKKLIGNMAAGGLLVASAFGVVEGRSNDPVNAAFDSRVAPGQEVCVQVGRPGDVLVSNGTITNATGPGYATQGPRGANPNAYSTHNFDDSAARPNLNMTKIKADGNVCVTPSQSSAHVLIDAIGFIPGSMLDSYGGSEYPRRIMDTRIIPEPGYPIATGAIGGVSVTAVCSNLTGNDYVRIDNVSNEQITAVISPYIDAQFQLLNPQVVMPSGASNTGFNIRTVGTKPSLTVNGRAGQVTVDLTPCGTRPPIITPSVLGSISKMYVTRECIGPNEGAITLYTNDSSSLTRVVNIDKNNDGTVDTQRTLGVSQPLYLIQTSLGDYHSLTVEGESGKLVVDYQPCKILPAGHRGNVTQFPL